ncbi:hypothetical protein [Kitasatospora sp. GP82]|uniref:DUF6197 family protein n=1 Tax=Kitasatospora sp. GP82 TaxID=3035089 RepID=UPI002473EFF1|nr:hypothetical protein [Kitasatospora sp. GP82]MDH6124474.1 hypothetical protein [Kitasatospora sp. GP82]
MPILARAPHPFVLTPDGSGLIAEIEEYLASLPAPARIVVPCICAHGSVRQPWNADRPAPRQTLLDRLVRRPARPVPVTVADHLQLASRYITFHGWLQGAMWDSAGRVCLLGAQAAVLAHGYGTPDSARRARTQVMEVLRAAGHPVDTPDQYNDDPATRQADIHQLLGRAATRAHRLGI